MGRSLVSGLRPEYSFALFRLAFATAPHLLLNLASIVTRRFILQKARHHPLTALTFVSTRFQVLFHSPSGVLFTFPLTVLVHYRSLEYLALGDGPPRFRRNFTCSAVLRIHSGEITFDYRTFTFYGWLFQNHSSNHFLCNSVLSVLQPQ